MYYSVIKSIPSYKDFQFTVATQKSVTIFTGLPFLPSREGNVFEGNFSYFINVEF